MSLSQPVREESRIPCNLGVFKVGGRIRNMSGRVDTRSVVISAQQAKSDWKANLIYKHDSCLNFSCMQFRALYLQLKIM